MFFSIFQRPYCMQQPLYLHIMGVHQLTQPRFVVFCLNLWWPLSFIFEFLQHFNLPFHLPILGLFRQQLISLFVIFHLFLQVLHASHQLQSQFLLGFPCFFRVFNLLLDYYLSLLFVELQIFILDILVAVLKESQLLCQTLYSALLGLLLLLVVLDYS